MTYSQNSQCSFYERQLGQISNGSSNHQPRSTINRDYAHRIALDSLMVSNLPFPKTTIIIPGIIRPADFYDCTITTQSTSCGPRIYPYGIFAQCTYRISGIYIGTCPFIQIHTLYELLVIILTSVGYNKSVLHLLLASPGDLLFAVSTDIFTRFNFR